MVLTEILYAYSPSAGQHYECARFDIRERYRHPLGRDAHVQRSYVTRVAREAVLAGLSAYKAAFNPRQ